MTKQSKYVNALDAILQDKPIAYYRVFATISKGGVAAGVFLSQAVYWSPRATKSGGWFYKSRNEWTEETGLTRYEQEAARKALKDIGVLEEKLMGVPATLHYRLNMEILYDILSSHYEENSNPVGDIPTNQLAENHQLVGGKTTNFNTETTTEITTETTTDKRGAGKNQPAPFPEDVQENLHFEEDPKAKTEEVLQAIRASSYSRQTVPPAAAPTRLGTEKRGDLVDGILHYARKNGQADVSAFPEGLQPLLKAFCQTFGLVAPVKTGRKGDQYSLWIGKGRELLSACAEFGPDLMADVKTAWPFDAPPGNPGSVITFAMSQAAKKRLEGKAKTERRVYTEEEKAEYWRNAKPITETNPELFQKNLNSGMSQGL